VLVREAQANGDFSKAIKKEGVLCRDVPKTPSYVPKLQVRANACLIGNGGNKAGTVPITGHKLAIFPISLN
jgi:hypothetical protein